MPGRFLPGWLPAVESVCLTGVAQVAHCWLLMHAFTGEARYRDAARLANRFVRRTVSLDGPPETRGGIKGSFPIDGDYAPYEYVSWAAKFAADSLMLEMDTAPSPRIESASYHHRAAERLRTSDLLALALHAHGTVLDVGARDGYHARLLADRFDQVTALVRRATPESSPAPAPPSPACNSPTPSSPRPSRRARPARPSAPA